MKRIEIDKETLKDEDTTWCSTASARRSTQAIEQADKQMEAELDKITGGVKIPGMV